MTSRTLTDTHGAERTLADWGLSSLERTLSNQTADSVRFDASGNYDIAGYYRWIILHLCQ